MLYSLVLYNLLIINSAVDTEPDATKAYAIRPNAAVDYTILYHTCRAIIYCFVELLIVIQIDLTLL